MRHFLLITSVIIAQFATGQKKLALIVAIGEYQPSSRIRPIASVNDVKYIQAVLTRNGFEQIQTLINSKATKKAITDSLDALAAKSDSGDIVVIHFACHGQQIRDQRTEALGKDEDDGYDEALLPYDVKTVQYEARGYKGEYHLRDDEIHIKLEAIRKRLGKHGSLLVLMDACHSGTGTRNSDEFAVSRGEPTKFEDPENPLTETVTLSQSNRSKGYIEGGKDEISNLVFISGSGPHQLNYQMKVDEENVGSLSYSFYKAMMDLQAGSSYNVLYHLIKTRIQAERPEQMPMAEGDLDQVVFSGKYVTQDDKVPVRIGRPGVKVTLDSIFTIERGMMDNITTGATGKLFRPGKNEPLANVVIKKTEHFKSIGVADKLLNGSEAYDLKLDEENYGPFSASLKIQPDNSPHTAILKKQLKQFILPYKYITLGENPDFLLTIKVSDHSVNSLLIDRNNRNIWTSSIAEGDTLAQDDLRQLLAGMRRSIRIKYLRTMPNGGALSGLVSVQLIPEKTGSDTTDLWMERGEGYTIRMQNNSDSRLYYTVMSITTDNDLEIVYPNLNQPQDYSIESGGTVSRKVGVSNDATIGREIIKVIFSKEPMDLRSVIERKKERNDVNSFQKLLDDLFKDSDDRKSTRTDVSSLKVDDIAIISASFGIKK